jgi:hypothetical protein
MRGLVAVFCLASPAGAECLTLGDLGYVLPVDGEVTVTELSGEVTLDLAPGGRAPKIVRIGSLAGKDLVPDPTLDREELPNGLVAHYRTTVDEAAGSGGSEVLLSGWLEGAVPLGIGCWTQTEYGSPDWCLPILGELRPEADGCETKED